MLSSFQLRPYLWILAVFLTVSVNFAIGILNFQSFDRRFKLIEDSIKVIGTIVDASEALQIGRISDSKARIREAISLSAHNPAQQVLFGEALNSLEKRPASQGPVISMLWKARHGERSLLAERITRRNESFQHALRGAVIGSILSLLALAIAAFLTDRHRRQQQALAAEISDSQVRFEAFMDNSPLRANMRDEESRMVWMSKKYSELIPQSKNWLGNNDYAGLPKEIVESQKKTDRELLKTGATLTDYIQYNAGNDRRDLMVVKFIVPSSKGRMIGHFTLDVTEKADIERKLAAYTRDLENKNRELQDFASVAAHDLQEPLRLIVTYGGLLDESMTGNTNAEAKEHLAVIRNASKRMRKLIEDLLSYTRISSQGGIFQEIDLNQVLQQACSDLAMRITKSQARLNAPQLPSIEADPSQMRQLFQNLISNSIKYCDQDKAPEINISFKRQGANVELSFKDNGIGFEIKYKEKIFELFQRLHGNSKYSGTGMGLAICKKIVERHNGTISAESQAGQGATFTVILPLRQAAKLF